MQECKSNYLELQTDSEMVWAAWLHFLLSFDEQENTERIRQLLTGVHCCPRWEDWNSEAEQPHQQHVREIHVHCQERRRCQGLLHQPGDHHLYVLYCPAQQRRVVCHWHLVTHVVILATNVGMIVGATVGSLVGFIFLLLVCLFFLAKRRQDSEDDMANEIKWVQVAFTTCNVTEAFTQKSWTSTLTWCYLPHFLTVRLNNAADFILLAFIIY